MLCRGQEAKRLWEAAVAAYTAEQDLALLLEAQAHLAGKSQEDPRAGPPLQAAAGQPQVLIARPLGEVWCPLNDILLTVMYTGAAGPCHSSNAALSTVKRQQH